jgi:cyanophycin synthetase
MNVFDEHGFKVILDYGHNPDAVEVMCQLTDRIEVKGKKLVVLAGPGDRRDEDIREIALKAAGRFAHYFCRRDDSLRGRTDEEVPRILRETLLAAGVPDKQITVIADEQRAVDAALRMARQGDLLLVFGDSIARTWKQIIHFSPKSRGAPAVTVPARVEVTSPAPGAELPDAEQLISDGRGVRLAREADD